MSTCWRTALFAALGTRPPHEQPLDLIVRTLALLQPIWFALVLAAVGALAIVDGDDRGWALAAAAGALVVVSADALAATRRTARLRASPAAAAAPKRRMRPLRLAAVAAAVLGVAAGAASFATPTVAPDPVFVQISSASLDTDVARGEYLRQIGLSTASFTRAQLTAPGLTVTYRIQLRAQPDDPITMQLELYDARTAARVSASAPVVLRLETLLPAGKRRDVDPKKIVLLRLSGARRPVPDGSVTRQYTFWIVRPPRSGRYFATVRASDGPLVLTETQTQPFAVAEP